MSICLSRTISLVALIVCLLPPSYAADDETQKIALHPAVIDADWSKVTEVVVELDDNSYEPHNLRFSVGKPYKMLLKNIGGAAHDMVGGSLFNEQVMALRMINTRVGRVTAENISSVYIRPKQEAEVWFVPLKKGTYSFFCSIPGHREAGMEGGVAITD